MIINKVITVSIDVYDTIGLYSNLEVNITNILADRFEGRCFRAVYVKKINKIIKVSDCRINQDGFPNYGIVDVMFEVTAIVYMTGEFINGCKVEGIDHDHGIILCSTPIASIMMNTTKLYESIKVGQMITVRVGDACYNIGARKISVNATPFEFDRRPMVYSCGAPVTDETVAYVKPMMVQVRAEEALSEAARKANPVAWDFFAALIYPYLTPGKAAPSGAKKLDIVAIATKPTSMPKYISGDPTIAPTTSTIYGWDSPPDDALERSLVHDTPIGDAVVILLSEYMNRLKMVREMTEIYNTNELLEKHKDLWLIFRAAKLK